MKASFNHIIQAPIAWATPPSIVMTGRVAL
jgi:hypothetical protein